MLFSNHHEAQDRRAAPAGRTQFGNSRRKSIFMLLLSLTVRSSLTLVLGLLYGSIKFAPLKALLKRLRDEGE